MASQRRLTLTLTRHFRFLLPSSPPPNLTTSQTLILRSLHLSALRDARSNSFVSLHRPQFLNSRQLVSTRHFSSRPTHSSGEDDEDDDEEEEDGDDEEEGEEDYADDDESCNGSINKFRVCGKTEEEKVTEAAEIGYKVIGPLDPSEQPFKPWEPVFAVVQVCDSFTPILLCWLLYSWICIQGIMTTAVYSWFVSVDWFASV